MISEYKNVNVVCFIFGLLKEKCLGMRCFDMFLIKYVFLCIL